MNAKYTPEGKFIITEEDYQKLIENAINIRDNQDQTWKPKKLFRFVDDFPTVKRMQASNVGPEEDSRMDIFLLAYLVFYGEMRCVDDENDEWEYIYTPDPRYFSSEEIEEFNRARKYIERTIIKKVERV